MQVQNNTVVALNYCVKNAAGAVLQDNMASTAVEYVHGSGSIIPMLEAAVAGMEPGEQKSVSMNNEQLGGVIHLDLHVKAVRPATATEISNRKPAKPGEDCGPGCNC